MSEASFSVSFYALGFIIGMFVSLNYWNSPLKEFKKEAVEHNYATIDSEGEFHWNQPKVDK